MKTYIKPLAIIALVGLAPTASLLAEQSNQAEPFFGMYGTVKDTAAETREYILKCKEAGINVLIPSLSGGGGVIWKTDTEFYYPPLQAALDSGYDSLADFIKVAHENGMKVIPSIAIGPINKLAKEHPEWVTRDRNGKPSTETGPTSLAFSYPEARAAKIANLIDLIKGYEVDGIVLDYCRYPEHTKTPETAYGYYGYDEPLVKACQEIYGFDPRKETLNSQRWHLFSQLRMDSVTAFVMELRAEMKKSGKNVSLIAFGDTDPVLEANCCGRDYASWSRKGLVDAFLAGSYTETPETMGKVLAKIREAIGPKMKLYPSLTPFNDRIITEAQMLEMAKICLEAGSDGLWIYRDDYFEKHNLWDAASKTSKLLNATRISQPLVAK